VPRLFHEMDAMRFHPPVVSLEIVRVQEEEHAATRLVSNTRSLFGVRSFRQQQLRLVCARRRDTHEALFSGERRVLDEDEAEFLRIPSDRLVVVANHKSHMGYVHGNRFSNPIRL